MKLEAGWCRLVRLCIQGACPCAAGQPSDVSCAMSAGSRTRFACRPKPRVSQIHPHQGAPSGALLRKMHTVIECFAVWTVVLVNLTW